MTLTHDTQHCTHHPLVPFAMWSAEQFAEFLGISLRHLTDLRTEDPTFPVPLMLGSVPRWSTLHVAAWMAPPSTARPAAAGSARSGKASKAGAGYVD